MRDDEQFDRYWTEKREADRTSFANLPPATRWLTLIPLIVISAVAIWFKTRH